MKKSIRFALLALTVAAAFSCNQKKEIKVADLAENLDAPLIEVLEHVLDMFNFDRSKIDYSIIPEGTILNSGYYLIRPWSFDESLKSVLNGAGYGIDYDYDTGFYLIVKRDYYSLTKEEGVKMLNYLGSKYNDVPSWEKRRDSLKVEMRHVMGLDNFPEHYSGAVYLSDKREYDGYYVQNIGLEILPGVYATGALYHPTGHEGEKLPVILNPHGHFEHGRYAEYAQKRFAMQAKLGCIALTYDMFCWGEQPMFPREWHWTLLAQPYQMLSAERMMDWLCALPEADLDKVGITGASGGGTQTMFITAIDDRVKLSMPIVMPSAYYCGGCSCEGGTGIHLCGGRTNNMEIAAMCAPKPMLIVSDGGDWTDDTPEVELPFVKRIYGFYGAEDMVENVHLVNEVHDYGPSKRAAAYDFIVKQWGLDNSAVKNADGTYDESGCVFEDYDLLKVWGPKGENWPENAIGDIGELARALCVKVKK